MVHFTHIGSNSTFKRRTSEEQDVDRLSWLRASEIGSYGIDGNGRSGWKLTVDPLELFYRVRKAKYVPLESKFHIVCTVNFCQRAEGRA